MTCSKTFALCIDAADMLVDSGQKTISEFYEKIVKLADLAAGVEHRYAEPAEIFMQHGALRLP